MQKRKKREKSAEVKNLPRALQSMEYQSPVALKKNNNTTSSHDMISNLHITHSFNTSGFCQCGLKKDKRSIKSSEKSRDKSMSEKNSQGIQRKQSIKSRRQQDEKKSNIFHDEMSSPYESKDTSMKAYDHSPVNINITKRTKDKKESPKEEVMKKTIEVNYNEK